MTAAVDTRCPKCGSDVSVPMSDGRLCLNADCRNEWNPDDVDWSNVHTIGEAAAEVVVDAILGPPESVTADEAARAQLAALIGTDVILEGGQRATVVDFPDDDHVRVWFHEGDDVEDWATVSFNDVVRSVDAPQTVDVTDDVAADLGSAAVMLAGMIVNAGIETVDMTTTPPSIKQPPTGWCPPDVDILPLIETAAAFAIASVIVNLDHGMEVAELIARQYLAHADTATTEGNDN